MKRCTIRSGSLVLRSVSLLLLLVSKTRSESDGEVSSSKRDWRAEVAEVSRQTCKDRATRSFRSRERQEIDGLISDPRPNFWSRVCLINIATLRNTILEPWILCIKPTLLHFHVLASRIYTPHDAGTNAPDAAFCGSRRAQHIQVMLCDCWNEGLRYNAFPRRPPWRW